MMVRSGHECNVKSPGTTRSRSAAADFGWGPVSRLEPVGIALTQIGPLAFDHRSRVAYRK